MMLTLILMRHAKSSWDDPSLSDHDRPLNTRGKRSAIAMGGWLRAQGHLPDAALVSSSERTTQTFYGLATDVPVRFTSRLYHASDHDMLSALQTADSHTILMLGHNPGISIFARRIVVARPRHPRFDDYPTGATLVAQFYLYRWADVEWGTGEAIDFAIPREVLAQAGL
ncbi:MAG: histidine phosphatase family protein [Paracoccaceae bacterium]